MRTFLLNYLLLKIKQFRIINDNFKIKQQTSIIQISEYRIDMASSPYISNQIKQYMRKYDIQKLMNNSVNELLRNKPQDPYGYLVGIFQKLASSDIQIKMIKAYEVISGEGIPVIKLSIKVVYLNKQIQFVINQPFGILNDQSVQYDTDRLNGKGMNKSIALINDTIVPKIVGYKCKNQIQIDKILESLLQQLGNNSLYCINNVSYVIPKIQAHVLSKPLFSVVQQLAQSSASKLNIMVNCLQGGKLIGSKCKVFKYSIISKQNYKDAYLAQIILAAIRKTIVSGKGGENALKFASDGSFICPVDSIMDNLKIVQQAINSSNGRQHFGVGLNWAADTLYNVDTKKYQSQNPKTPFDNDQMVDYMIKILTDRPIIIYLQDPLASSQIVAWKKLRTKLASNENLKHVKIGTRNQKLLPILTMPFSQDNIKVALNKLSVHVTSDSHPELTEEQRTQTNINKFNLDYFQLKLFELKTLSNIIKVQKILNKTNTQLILQDNLFETYDTSIVDICYGLGAMVNLSTINGGKYDKVSKLGRIKEIKDNYMNKGSGDKTDKK